MVVQRYKKISDSFLLIVVMHKWSSVSIQFSPLRLSSTSRILTLVFSDSTSNRPLMEQPLLRSRNPSTSSSRHFYFIWWHSSYAVEFHNAENYRLPFINLMRLFCNKDLSRTLETSVDESAVKGAKAATKVAILAKADKGAEVRGWLAEIRVVCHVERHVVGNLQRDVRWAEKDYQSKRNMSWKIRKMKKHVYASKQPPTLQRFCVYWKVFSWTYLVFFFGNVNFFHVWILSIRWPRTVRVNLQNSVTAA